MCRFSVDIHGLVFFDFHFFFLFRLVWVSWEWYYCMGLRQSSTPILIADAVYLWAAGGKAGIIGLV